MTRQDGFILHFGYVAVAAILLIAAGSVLSTLGWRWLWMVPALGLGLVLLNVVVVLFEDRWRMVTEVDVAQGAPETCRDCDYALGIVSGKTGFKVRCPICGHRESGLFHPSRAAAGV